MDTHYDNVLLSEMEREAYRTDNKLAQAILQRLEAEVEQAIHAETTRTKYAEPEGVPV